MLKKFKIFKKNDGYDYENLIFKILNNQIPMKQLHNNNPNREVFYLNFDNRDFIFKNDRELSKHFEKRLWQRISGSFYSKLFKKVNKAKKSGCNFIQDIYFVAEKTNFGLCKHSYVLIEFLKGEQLSSIDKNKWPDFFPQIIKTVSKLHKSGLASNDLHPGNLIINNNTINLIDLNPNGLITVCKANDLLALKKIYNLNLVPNSLIDKIFYKCIYLRNKLQKKN